MFTFTLLETFIVVCTCFAGLTAFDLLKNVITDLQNKEEN
jgi:hypothetical protein